MSYGAHISSVLELFVLNYVAISTNESFRIDYNVTRGMELEFYRNNSIVDRQESDTEQHQVPIYF